MSFGAVAAVVSGVVSAGAGIYSSKQQAKQASAAADAAASNRSRALSTIDQASRRTLELPEFDAFDKTGEFQASQFDLFEGLSTQQGDNKILGSLFSSIAEAFRQDTQNADAVLDDVFDFSQRRDALNATATSNALDAFAPGASAARQSASESLASFLNFEVPDRLANDLNRQAAEQGFRTGNIGGGINQDFSQRLRFNELSNNFFRANEAFNQSQVANAAVLGPIGLQDQRLPQSGQTLDIELGNFQARADAAAANYEARLNQEIANFNIQQSQTLANFEREDAFDMLKANIQADRANADQQRANALSAQSAATLQQGIQQATQTVVGGFNRIGSRPATSPPPTNTGQVAPLLFG